jgi:hypothetical protein
MSNLVCLEYSVHIHGYYHCYQLLSTVDIPSVLN